MNWNAKPESTTLPPPYPKSQASILQQYLIHQPPTASQSSIIYPANNQEACMYSSNPNSVSQPLPNIRNYKTPQIPVSSGIMQNVWLNSPIRNSMSSHTEAIVSHQTDFGANMLYVHVPQNQLLTSDTYSMQLQMTPSNSVRDPVTCQGNQGLNHSVPDQLVDWAQQYTSNELTYPDYPTVQKQNIMPSTSLQVKNNQLSTSAQTLQAKHLVPVSFQYAMDTNRRPPPPSYNCRFGSQPGQAPQPAVKHLSVEIPQSSEVHSSEQRKDLCKRFQQQWQNANENSGTIGNVCEFNVKQPYNEPVRSSVEGAQTPTQNNQEKKLYSCNTNANLVLDTNITKEKLVRDIKSLVEIKKKFSELARKIKINKDLLMAAGCSKAANSSYGEPAQHCEFSTKGMPAKSDSHCSMELLATCLSLWKNQPPKPTGEKALKSSEEERCSKSRANIATDRSAKPVEVKSLCSAEGNSQKTVNPSQTVLSVVTQSYESSGGTVAKGTELQIAVVSPLILSSVKALPEKGVGSVGPLYPVVKEGSVCTLQNQLAEDTTLAAALNFDVKVPAAHGPLAEGSLPAQKEKGYESLQEYPQVTRDASPGKLLALDDQQALPKPSDSTVASGHTLQIESICSLAEGDVSYNSQIAEIFNSFPLKNDVLQKPLSPGQQLVSSQQKEQVGHTTSNNVFGFREDKSVQCTGNPHEVMGRPAFLQSLQPSTLEHAEADRETVEESNLELTTKTESTAKHACGPPAAPQQDPCPPEEEVCPSHFAQDPIVDEMCDEKEPVLCLHDQLSELLKEFPYGIEAVSRREGCVGQQKADQILENQTRDKTGCVSEDNTDQIQITILSSEQIKELFPEEDSQPCDIGRLAEPEKETAVAEVGSLCDPQALSGESCDPIMLDSEKDKIHCCALGWLSKVYEGVPQCRCGSSKSAGSEGEGENENKNEVISQLSLKCESKDRKDTSKINQGSSLKIGQKMTSQFPSKCDKPDPLNSHSRKKALKFFDVSFNSCNNRPTFSEQVPQESLQKKHSPQNSGLLKAQGHLLPKKDLCRRNGSLVLSASPEKKKLKFKAGGSKLKYFEKRKTDHGIISDLEIKKKKYEKQDQPKNVGGTVSLCSTPTSPDEQSGVKEKMVSNSEPSDLKSRSSKTPRVITVKEYLQRQKNKDIIRNNASKSCVRNVPCGSEQEPSQLLAPAGWEKGAGKDSNSAESLRELGPAPTSSGKNKAEDPKTCDVSKRVQGKVDGKPPDKALANVSNEAESGQLLRQAKEQRKLYLNRVAFKCTEKESICLTRLDSASQKVSKDRKSHENTPKTDDVKKPSLLEFKLCPDTLLKTTNSVDKPDNPTSGKDPASLQVSGIKSTKEDWLKCGPTRTKASETSQEIDNANSRVSKRSFSADGFETVQNPVKDSNTMFRTYKQMYLDKRNRSQSLESSSVK
uniref:Retroelement silencing factor 1 n=1 Tax=Jaculus jaculus TaxID=51337 RepID=A0A8C5K207_JACJA